LAEGGLHLGVPRLWIEDLPGDRVRPIPPALGLPEDPKAIEAFLRAASRYRLNALSAKALPGDADTAAYVRELATRHYIKVLDAVPKSPACPYPFALAWANRGAAARYALAACGEAHWGETDPDADTFIERFARETFGTADAAEALRLAKDHLGGWLGVVDPAALAGAVRKGMVPDAVRDEVKAVRSAVKRMHRVLKDVRTSPDVRDAFLAGADRALCNAENSLALLEAGSQYKRGRASRSVRVLKARLSALEALGDDGAAVRESLTRWIDLFEAASQVAHPPSLEELVAKGWRK